MSLRYHLEIDRITEPEWNLLLPEFSDASLYQTWAYGAVSWGEHQLCHAVLKDGNQPVAIAQLRLVRIPVIGRGVAYLRWGPLCTTSGPQFDGAIFREMISAIVREYVERRRLLLRVVPRLFTQDPEGTLCQQIFDDLGFTLDSEARPYHTLRVDLSPSLEHLRKSLDQKWRNQLNGAERNGLTIQQGTSDDLFAQFLALYDEMMARKQFETTVDPQEFRRIQSRLPDDQKMLILIAQKDGRPMTGLIGSVTGDMGIYLLGATSDEGMKTKGSYLLQWTFLQTLKARGCRWYDLGGINPETNPGVYHFKQGLAGQEVRGFGRLELSADTLSAASVRGAEHLRSLMAKVRSSVR